MIKGLTMKHIQYFGDMLIMANDHQLLSMGDEIILELKKRRQRNISVFDDKLEQLPRFKGVWEV